MNGSEPCPSVPLFCGFGDSAMTHSTQETDLLDKEGVDSSPPLPLNKCNISALLVLCHMNQIKNDNINQMYKWKNTIMLRTKVCGHLTISL